MCELPASDGNCFPGECVAAHEVLLIGSLAEFNEQFA